MIARIIGCCQVSTVFGEFLDPRDRGAGAEGVEPVGSRRCRSACRGSWCTRTSYSSSVAIEAARMSSLGSAVSSAATRRLRWVSVSRSAGETIAFSAGDPTGPSLPGDISMARRAAPVLVVGTQSSTRIWVRRC